MKYARTLLILSAVALIVGAFVYASLSQTTLIAEQVKITPKPFDLENPDSCTVTVKLKINDTPIVDQINPDTVLLEGFMSPTDHWLAEISPEFVAVFDGTMVANWVKVKISHLVITTPKPWVPIKIQLRISGELYDTTPWEGYGEIKVFIPDPGTPPPPPPP